MFLPGNERHYFHVGRSGLFAVVNVLNIRGAYRGGDEEIGTILDFGCGHGRVARWLRVAFPNAVIDVTDYNPSAVNWCVDRFACRQAPAAIAAGFYDLIWAGSVFTHHPAAAAASLLVDLLGALRPNGVLVFTTHGRFSVERMVDFDWENDRRSWLHYNLSQKQFASLVTQYRASGYAYIDYETQNNYGISIVNPSWYSRQMNESNKYLQISLQEKGFDNHQDVIAFMRADLLDPGYGPLW
jgi:SAM-dependent methyltransferase